MPEPVRVAILGFSAFERHAMQAYFNLGGRRSPGYDCVLDADSAQFIVADADQPGVVALLRTLGRTGDAVFIGARGPAQAAAWMMRPINPVHVLRELDSLLRQRSLTGAPAPPAPAAPAWAPAPARRASDARGAEPPAAQQAAAATGSASPAVDPARRALAEARRHHRLQALRPHILRRALLVDDSEVALSFLRRQLEPYGLDCDLVRHSHLALQALMHQAYGLVFLDVDLGEGSALDGLALCQAIKQRRVSPGGQAPLVVMVSAFHEPLHQVRGTLAGADAYLGKPLDFLALDALLQGHGLSPSLPVVDTLRQPPQPRR